MSEQKYDEVSGEIVLKVPRDSISMIPSLLNLIKQEYVAGKRKGISDDPELVKQQRAAELAIEGAIFSWIDEMKEEKAKKDMMEKIRRRFDQRWNSW